MDFSIFATLMVLLFLTVPQEVLMRKLEDLHNYPKEHHKIVPKRLAITSSSNEMTQKEFNRFLEEKLVQYSQALELIMKLVRDAVNAINALAENMSRNIEEPALPQEIEEYNRDIQDRSGDENKSRRSFSGKPLKLPHVYTFNKGSYQWCPVAILCHKTRKPVCGFDDRFGYGKFDDFCHMLRVNCYWNYNFGLVPYCRPTK